ncbi:MAG: hypothetical protein HC824_12360 [Synechococcales cyanobacterium RM1_1_8]|nr:hypothetical protein [Synechococcales cyanobacterium RM1_1_8]
MVMMALSTVVLSSIVLSSIVLSTVAGATALPGPDAPLLSQADGGGETPRPPSRRIRRADIWQEVYRQLPDLPREDQAMDQASGQTSSGTHTLVGRLIEYHNFRKGRSPISRFDWKLTLADYLGLHEPLVAAVYPGATTLRQNPMAGDVAAIATLSRQQRDQLINSLVSLYNPTIPTDFFTPLPCRRQGRTPLNPCPPPASPRMALVWTTLPWIPVAL